MGKELVIETLLCFFLEVHQRLRVKKPDMYLAIHEKHSCVAILITT